ncbi:TPA: hypothetical protein GRR50_22980 [Vibrio parahaemolyticus]|nr:hypothetical protein [Vibrio parahaemolyticus]
MLQTNFQQVTNAEFQLVTTLLLLETQRSRRPANEELLINLPLPHFTPTKITTNRRGNPMRQPTDFGMFYGLRNSRILADNAKLPTPKTDC